jgi:predicted unusual protein kinase regulating ubiquinone biosynthesis (AarF/ABC1/UbiB family)
VAIYTGYKFTQARVKLLAVQGPKNDQRVADIWKARHKNAGKDMLSLCIDLQGFYIKAGQFMGSRGDFIPLEICESLAALQDQVPPMKSEKARSVIERELAPLSIDDVFYDLDLEKPLGSASIAQVHKGHMRKRASRGRGNHDNSSSKGTPVAVKIQYPDAEKKMVSDFHNLRKLASVLQVTDLKFDLVSAVDELESQVRLEFDFRREASIMNGIADNLKRIERRVKIPRSVPGLVTKRMLVMDYLDGVQVTRLADCNISEAQRKIAAKRVLTRLSEAYGRMMLTDGIFQADGHPGNILVMKGGQVGLLDYGQSKILEEGQRLNFARMIVALNDKDKHKVVQAMSNLGIVTEKQHLQSQCQHAYNMFDTMGKMDAFGPNSVLKANPVKEFPGDFFFVLRVVQLLRGLAHGMGVDDFSCAGQWKPYARAALKRSKVKV